jgi:hypothetical protein
LSEDIMQVIKVVMANDSAANIEAANKKLME